MRLFDYHRAIDPSDAVHTAARQAAQAGENSAFIAGGTVLLDLMKLDALHPTQLIDINDLAPELGRIEFTSRTLELGALVRMSEAAGNERIKRDLPVITQSLQLAASAQLRNMASLGGNVLQRTRCQYFRETSWSSCNKRVPGSGCAAMDGVNRKHAVLGVSDACISSYPGDFAQALVALGADVLILGPQGRRRISFDTLHCNADDPSVETVLGPGDLITGFSIPLRPWTRRSLYLKIRDRQSYEFALASAAVALDMTGARVKEARIALGGLAYRPWRAHAAEASLSGRELDAESASRAADAAFAEARPQDGNQYKIALGKRTLVRALLQAAELEI